MDIQQCLRQTSYHRCLYPKSTLLTDEWLTISHKSLGIDNATRWNSWYTLITVAIEKKEKLMAFSVKHHNELGDNVLSPSDWELLQFTKEFLQPFTESTLIQQTRWSSLYQSLCYGTVAGCTQHTRSQRLSRLS
jgi:hypothetical protein